MFFFCKYVSSNTGTIEFRRDVINPFHANILILHSLETPENQITN